MDPLCRTTILMLLYDYMSQHKVVSYTNKGEQIMSTIEEIEAGVYQLTNTTGNSIEVMTDTNATIRSLIINKEEMLFYPKGKKTSDGGIPGPFFPWGGRIEAAKFSWNDKKYDLTKYQSELKDDGQGNPLHGLCVNEPWEVLGTNSSKDSVSIELQFDAGKNKIFTEIFKTAALIKLSYTLSGSELLIETSVTNTGENEFPMALCFHPWFLIPDGEEGKQVQILVPANKHAVTEGVPLPRSYEDASGIFELKNLTALGENTYDDGLTDLLADAQGTVTSKIVLPNGTEIQIEQNKKEFPHVVLWHSDPNITGFHNVSIEPQTGFFVEGPAENKPPGINPGITWNGTVKIRVN